MTEERDDSFIKAVMQLGPAAFGLVTVGTFVWSLSNTMSTISTTLMYHNQELVEITKVEADQQTKLDTISEQIAQVQQQLIDIKGNQTKGGE